MLESLVAYFVPSASAAEYSLSGSDVTALGSAGTDTANSLIGVVVDLIPVMIPLIVVYFVIRVILHYFGRK